MAEAQGQRAVAQQANIKYGVYSQGGAFVGKTVDQVRAELGNMWSIPGDATAYKGKEAMKGDYVIKPGDSIEFHRKMGEKGLA